MPSTSSPTSFASSSASSSNTLMNGESEMLPKRVDRTVKISTITKGVPLRRPNVKPASSLVSSYANREASTKDYTNTTIFSSAASTDPLMRDEALERSLKPGLKTTILDQFIVKKDYSEFSNSRTNSIETADDDFSLCSDKSSPCKPNGGMSSVKQRISYAKTNVAIPNSKSNVHMDSDYLMDAESVESVVNESTVKFVQKELFAKVEFAFTGSDEVYFDHPIGVAELKSKEIVIADTFADKMHLFSQDGKYIREFGSSTILKQPSAIVVLPDGSFAVRNSRDITVFSPECIYQFSIGSDYLRKPFGITADCEGNLITLDTGYGEFMTIVHIDSQTGNLIKKISVVSNVPKSLLGMSKPRFIAFKPPSSLLVVDLGLNKVYIVSMKSGLVLKSFGKSGSRDGEFNDPSGIVCDADGFILVGDSRNHRIQIFTPNGDFVSILRIGRALKRPSGLYLTGDGYLLVLNYWENSLVKYKFISHNDQPT